MRHALLLALLLAPLAASAEPSRLHNVPPYEHGPYLGHWTGAEVIAWGQTGGARFHPPSDSWVPMSRVGIPEARYGATSVWTGAEMIVWGGRSMTDEVATGARYQLDRDVWLPVSASALFARFAHTAVWTGSEMIVWGGTDCCPYTFLADGARYDPGRDTWRPLSTGPGSPAGRYGHTAVWTGTEMIVWGGTDDIASYVATGSRYDPASDSWRPTSTAYPVPSARTGHTAVWTGDEMIVWGGSRDNTGGRYDPSTDSWRATASGTVAPAPRIFHGAVWTGSTMMVWGGRDRSTQSRLLADGGIYDPVADSWSAISGSAGSPTARWQHIVAWTGTEMLVTGGGGYGGPAVDSAAYRPATSSWRPLWTGWEVPETPWTSAAVWTGAEALVWGDSDPPVPGGRYALADDDWDLLPLFTPLAGLEVGFPSMVFTGSEVVIWGAGESTGVRVDPSTGSWVPTSTASASSGHSSHSAVWTGTRMIVFGGSDGTTLVGTGASYDPAADAWSPISSSTPRGSHTAVWTGSQMLVWGGTGATGERYEASSDSWSPVSSANAPAGWIGHTAVWTGTEMIVWGGTQLRTGARYDPLSDSWQPTSIDGPCPEGRSNHTAVWTGTEMIVWGGYLPYGTSPAGGRYDPSRDTWATISSVNEPLPREAHAAVWTGSEMLIFGGSLLTSSGRASMLSGGLYDPRGDSWRQGSPTTPLGDVTFAAMGPGGSTAFTSEVRGHRGDGLPVPWSFVPFPNSVGSGATIASGNVDEDPRAELLAEHNPDATETPGVRAMGLYGAFVPGLDFQAYGAPGYGVNVGYGAVGAIDGPGAILTGPGPSSVYGPHVRAFRYAAGSVGPLAKVSFYAYGTLRYGAIVSGGDFDADGFDEIVTGAGPGVVFGPHVRGFDSDGGAAQPMPGINFFAYGTLRYGARVGTGDVDGEGGAEILTGPGPSPAFASQLRGFDADGVATPIPGLSGIVFPGTTHGLEVAGSDVDGDGDAEIACGPGPSAAAASALAVLDYEGTLVPVAPLSLDVFGLTYGLRVTGGPIGY